MDVRTEVEGESQAAEKRKEKKRSNLSCKSVFCEPVSHFRDLIITIIIIIDFLSGLLPSGVASANHLSSPSEPSPSDSRSGNEKRRRLSIP